MQKTSTWRHVLWSSGVQPEDCDQATTDVGARCPTASAWIETSAKYGSPSGMSTCSHRDYCLSHKCVSVSLLRFCLRRTQTRQGARVTLSSFWDWIIPRFTPITAASVRIIHTQLGEDVLTRSLTVSSIIERCAAMCLLESPAAISRRCRPGRAIDDRDHCSPWAGNPSVGRFLPVAMLSVVGTRLLLLFEQLCHSRLR